MATERLSLRPVICVIVVVAVFLTSSAKAQLIGPYQFYDVTFQWPETFCIVVSYSENVKCRSQIPDNFTIFSLVPRYRFNNSAVPSYAKDHRCTKTPPVKVDFITMEYLDPISKELDADWPNIAEYQGYTYTEQEANMILWRDLWIRHGMCFDYPDQPLYYFGRPLKIIQQYNLKNILEQGGIRPEDASGDGYALIKITFALKNFFGYHCTIRCERASNTFLLDEIKLCYNKDHTIKNCPYWYEDCPEDWNTKIRFPSVTTERLIV